MVKNKKNESEVKEKEVEKFEEVDENETKKNNFQQFQLNADNDILVDDYARLISEKEDLTEKMSDLQNKIDKFEAYKINPNTLQIKNFIEREIAKLTDYKRIAADLKFKTQAEIMQGRLQAYKEVIERFEGKTLNEEYNDVLQMFESVKRKIAAFGSKDYPLFFESIKKKYAEKYGKESEEN
ncbi:MAG TPA: hypothetical protein PLQ81_01695 [bacterium]|nr:hypothetical protein [bacterium]